MTSSLIGLAFSLAWFVFAVPTAVFLLRAYGRSKMSGFIWLLMALVVWPFLARGGQLLMGVMIGQMHGGVNMFMTVNLVQTVIGGILLLLAVIILDKELGQRILPAQPMIPSTAIPAPPPPTDLR